MSDKDAYEQDYGDEHASAYKISAPYGGEISSPLAAASMAQTESWKSLERNESRRVTTIQGEEDKYYYVVSCST